MDLVKRHGEGPGAVLALRGLTFDIGQGSFLAITGRHGSGKTTLLNLIGGLDRPTSGSIRVLDRDLADLGEEDLARYRRDVVGIVVQDSQGPAAAERSGEERALPHGLSGGGKQRAALARALENSPALLLADEPTGNLDRESGLLLLDLLRGLSRERGLTVVVATESAEAARTADAILPLRDGRIEA